MNTIIQNLKNETLRAEQTFADIANSDSANSQAAMTNVAAMKQIYNILDKQCAKIKPQKDKSTSMKAVFIGDERFEAKTNKNVIEIICKHIVANHYKELSAQIGKMKSSVTGKMFVSKNAEEIENPTAIKVGRKTIYIDAYRMTTNNMMLFKKMMTLLNIDDVRIENVENAISA